MVNMQNLSTYPLAFLTDADPQGERNLVRDFVALSPAAKRVMKALLHGGKTRGWGTNWMDDGDFLKKMLDKVKNTVEIEEKGNGDYFYQGSYMTGDPLEQLGEVFYSSVGESEVAIQNNPRHVHVNSNRAFRLLSVMTRRLFA